MQEYATNGVVASTAFDLAAYPLDLIKTRLQMQGVGPAGSAPATSLPQYTSVFGAIGRIVAEERVIGLWRGAAFNIICHIPVQAMHYGLFELVTEPFDAPEPVAPALQDLVKLTRKARPGA